MRIVTADEIVAAFEKTGLRPVREWFGDRKTCGCAVTAICIADGLPVQCNRLDDEFGREGWGAIVVGFEGLGPGAVRGSTHPNYLAGREAAKRLGLPVEE